MSNLAHDLNAKLRTKDVLIEEQLNFNALLLSDATLLGLQKAGFQKPSPIQLKAIPIGKCGFDLMIESKSGTGKTAVFAIIALEQIKLSNCAAQVLILAPTREVAVQICNVVQTLGVGYKGLKVESFIGGFSVEDDIKKVACCHIVVGAPGRIKHLIKLGALKVSSIRLFILDEVDKLMEESFLLDVNEIYKSLPRVKQTITVSATYTNELKINLEKFMWTPTFITPNTGSPLLLGLRQFVSVVKCNLNVIHQMNIKNEALMALLQKISYSQCIIFSNYQTRAESVSNILNRKGWNSMYISAAQSQAERLRAINSLKEFKCRILLSTDLSARGIDASNVDLIINYDVPNDVATYLHRMGRAGRYGSYGACVTLAADGKDLTNFQVLLGNIGGTSMSVSKLPDNDEVPADLLNCDLNKFKVVCGIVDANKNDNDSVKESVMSMKNFTDKSQLKQKEEKEEIDHINKFLDIKNQNEKHIELQTSNLESQELLESLAQGKLIINIPSEAELKTKDEKREALGLDDINKFLDGKNQNKKLEELEDFNLRASQLKQKEEKEEIDHISKFLDIKKQNEKHMELQTSNLESQELLESLAQGKSISKNKVSIDASESSKKRKRNDESKIDSKSKDQILYKNIALLNATKLLVDDFDAANPENETVEAINSYLNMSKSGSEFNVVEGKDFIPDQPELNSKLENIFKLSFDFAVDSNASHWLDGLDEDFQEKVNLDKDDEGIVVAEVVDKHSVGYSEEEKSLPHERKHKHKRRHKKKKHNVDHQKKEIAGCAKTNDDVSQLCYNNYPGLYSEYEYSNNENYKKWFDYYSQELAVHAETFDDSASFENWFSQWQYQVEGLRDYVQQNIYLQEMNRYAFNKY